MLKPLQAIVKDFVRTAEPFDPARFSDSVAGTTSWGPDVHGGTNIHTHDLKTVSPQRVTFAPNWRAWALTAVFTTIGLAMLTAAFIGFYTQTFGIEGLLPIGSFGAAFLIAGLYLHRTMCRPCTFDRQIGIFWQGRSMPMHTGRPRDGETHILLDDIYALQIIREYCTDKDNGFYSYELNLVLPDGRRVPVIDHGHVAVIRRDAANLAAFLGDIPVWDASR